ncbi:hypothetical protein ZWY2020_006076 [Hordeum vulgare]|nr:hypothetical protein ZWY2020_006076 [Hordeum vulgare]
MHLQRQEHRAHGSMGGRSQRLGRAHTSARECGHTGERGLVAMGASDAPLGRGRQQQQRHRRAVTATEQQKRAAMGACERGNGKQRQRGAAAGGSSRGGQ